MVPSLPIRMLRTVLIALLLVGVATVLAPTASANDFCNTDTANQFLYSCSPYRAVNCVVVIVGGGGRC